MTNPKHTFFLESKPNESGEHLIFLNLSYGLRDFNVKTEKYKYLPLKLSTGYSIKKEDWDNKNYCANATYVRKKGAALNIALDKIKNTSIQQFQLFENEHNKKPTNEELKAIILQKLGKSKNTSNDISITQYISQTILKRTTTEITSTKRWSLATGKQYKNLKNHIENYEANRKTPLTFGKLTGEIFLDFFTVINDLNYAEKEAYYAHNTVAKENKHFRAILNAAHRENIQIGFNHNQEEYEIQKREIKNEIVLTTEQLADIIKTDVKFSKEFTHAKNYILLSSFTGLRIGDMKYLYELLPTNQIHNSTDYFCITTQIRKNKENKDDLISIIPILDPIRSFLNQNNNKFPKFPAEANIRKDITKFLKHLKFENLVEIKKYYYKVDKAVIVKKKLCDIFGPHDCRSTFITNLKQLGIANELIEPITHPKNSSSSMIEKYDKSSLISKAVKLIDVLHTKNCTLYKY